MNPMGLHSENEKDWQTVMLMGYLKASHSVMSSVIVATQMVMLMDYQTVTLMDCLKVMR